MCRRVKKSNFLSNVGKDIGCSKCQLQQALLNLADTLPTVVDKSVYNFTADDGMVRYQVSHIPSAVKIMFLLHII
jgi:hypothetical protein